MRYMKLFLVIVLLVCFVGCESIPPGYVKVANIRPAVEQMKARHDEMLGSSDQYTPEEKAQFAATGEMLVITLDEAEGYEVPSLDLHVPGKPDGIE